MTGDVTGMFTFTFTSGPVYGMGLKVRPCRFAEEARQEALATGLQSGGLRARTLIARGVHTLSYGVRGGMRVAKEEALDPRSTARRVQVCRMS